jgi:hypothetical protein
MNYSACFGEINQYIIRHSARRRNINEVITDYPDTTSARQATGQHIQ